MYHVYAHMPDNFESARARGNIIIMCFIKLHKVDSLLNFGLIQVLNHYT